VVIHSQDGEVNDRLWPKSTTKLLNPILVVDFGLLYLLTFNVKRYNLFIMIRTFKDKHTEKIFNRLHSQKFPADIQRIAFRKLRMLNQARNINDLRTPPSNRLEKLKGQKTGQYSIRINDQWRICFEWHNNDANKVEIIDYHKG
jgi:toxin HigB-1